MAYCSLKPLVGVKLARDGAAVALRHAARRSLDDVLCDALRVGPTAEDLEEMFRLAEEGLRAVGLPHEGLAQSKALGVWAY
ncbi:MAG: hypothetical protein QXP98_07115 [Thermoproteus sp.]